MKNRFLLAALILSLLCVPTAFGQEQTKPLPDRWHGFVLEQSTPDDAFKVFGKPSKDSITSFDPNPISHWITKRRKEKIFRSLEYKKPTEGVDKAWLIFLEGKLVSIALQLKGGAVSPNALGAIYGVEFTPVIGQSDLAFSPRDFERNQGRIYPKTYPTVYNLVATSTNSFIAAGVGNVPSFGGALARSAGVPDKPGSFPGTVVFISLVSRTMENKDGADVLK